MIGIQLAIVLIRIFIGAPMSGIGLCAGTARSIKWKDLNTGLVKGTAYENGLYAIVNLLTTPFKNFVLNNSRMVHFKN